MIQLFHSSDKPILYHEQQAVHVFNEKSLHYKYTIVEIVEGGGFKKKSDADPDNQML
jgi:hypothetical protein